MESSLGSLETVLRATPANPPLCHLEQRFCNMQSNAVGGAMSNIRLNTCFTRTNKLSSLEKFNNQLFFYKKKVKKKLKLEVYNVKQ